MNISKTMKKILSISLCIALLLVSPITIGKDLFTTHASAAYATSYPKAHTNEYYYSSTQKFVTYLATGYGSKSSDNAKSALSGSGYSYDFDTLFEKVTGSTGCANQNLNGGVSGSSYVWLGAKVDTNVPTSAIRDIRIQNGGLGSHTLSINGYTYTVVGDNPISQITGDADGNVDLNRGKSSAPYLFYFATKDAGAGGPIVAISIGNHDYRSYGFDWTYYTNSNERSDANNGAGGDDIYTNVKRLPTVDTTTLRANLAAVAGILNAFSTSATNYSTAKSYYDTAKAIIDAFDTGYNFATGTTECFSTKYTQADINNAAENLAKVHLVTLNNQSGTGGTTSVIAINGSAMPTITAPTKEYCNFDGYYTSTYGRGTKYYNATPASANTASFTKDTTLYAKWTANSYKVTLDNQSATTAGTSAYYYMQNVEINNVYYYTDSACTSALANSTITVPTKTGYTFGGYYTGQNGTGTRYVNENGLCINNRYTVAGNVTLYAKWTPNTYSIAYNLNGGTLPSGQNATGKNGTSDQQVNPTSTTFDGKSGYSNWIKVENPTKADYKFAGWTVTGMDSCTHHYWSSSKDNTSTATSWSDVTYSEMYNLRSTSGTVTFTANWTVNSYKVTLDNQSATTAGTSAYYYMQNVEINNVYYYTDSACTSALAGSTITVPTKTGYTFGGYFTGKNGTGTQYVNENGLCINNRYQVAGDITLYAKWTANSYKVTLDNQSATTAGTSAYYYMQNVVINNVYYYTDSACTSALANSTITVPTKTGYTFGGYFTGKNGTGTQYVNENGLCVNNRYTKAGNVILYAKWTVATYKVTLDNQSATSAGTTAFYYKYNTVTNGNYYYNDASCTSALASGYIITVPTRTGYTFGGYFTGKNGTGTQYVKPDGVCTNNRYQVAGDVTLYAKWIAKSYDVLFDNEFVFDNINASSIKNGYNCTVDTDYDKNELSITASGSSCYSAPWDGCKEAKFAVIPGHTYRIYAEFTNTSSTEVSLTPVVYMFTFADSSVSGTSSEYYKAFNSTAVGKGKTSVIDRTWTIPAGRTYATLRFDIGGASAGIQAKYANIAVQDITDRTGVSIPKSGTNTAFGASVSYGSAVSSASLLGGKMPTETRTGYTLTGWNTKKDGSGKTYDVNTAMDVAGTLQLWSQWAKNTYTVTFKNGDTVLQSGKWEYGSTPTYNGTTPTKTGYTFAGWSPSITAVTGEATYTATWTINKYTVTWKNYDGATLETDENVEYGTTPSYDGETPTKARDVQYSYTFKGWSPEVSSVAGDVTYTAQYDRTTNKYTITWYDEDGTTVLATSKVSFGSTPSYPGSVAPKQGNNTNHFVHDGWTVNPVPVTGDASYIAKYKAARHTLAYTNYGDKHSAVCSTCGYATALASHRLGEDGTCEFCGSALADYTKVKELLESVPSSIYYTDSSYKTYLEFVDSIDMGVVDGKQSVVDNEIVPQVQAAINALEIKTYPVTLPSDCSVSYSKTDKTNCYMFATITAPSTKDGQKFAYWVDENGNVASTYRNYSFFSTTPRTFTPVYGEITEDKYISTEVLGVRDNLDGTYSILVEHSASTRVDINAHGVLFTFDEGSKSDLVFRTSNDAVFNPVAARTASTRTGLFEVKITPPAGADKIYLKSYVLKDGSETPVYSETLTVSISGASTNSATSFTVDEVGAENPSEYEPSPMPDYQLNFVEKIAAFFMSIWKFVASILFK